ncbi:MAG: bifunctional [glutamine synthetase] adenylyltransferase/[glutamine synthetase]-adenylyl-L-tyrosine phosphorylase, partial [Acidimicrobiia bacterium]
MNVDPSVASRLTAVGWVADGELLPVPVAALQSLATGPDPDGARRRLLRFLEADPANARIIASEAAAAEAAVAVCGASRALATWIARLPDELTDAVAGDVIPRLETADSWVGWLGAVRRFVRRGMLRIAIRDLLGMVDMPTVGGLLSDLADAAAAAALQAAQRRHHGPDIGFCVIAMGKWGGRELNYASDIDVLFAYDPGDVDPHTAHRHAQTLAQAFIDALAASTPEGTAFKVDADLRPEGTQGPLARSLDAYRNYYTQWSQPWELQALIKARPACGTTTTGTAFLTHTQPLTYPDTLPPNTLRTIRTLKARAEDVLARRGQSESEIKRGVGGIRDVEFAVQILQLVHGRFDDELRGGATLDALSHLSGAGYVRPDDATSLAASYRWLRNLEHRLQMWDLRRTHSIPSDNEGRIRVAKAMGYRDKPHMAAVDAFSEDLIHHRATVRSLHEGLFYRPLLEAFAASSAARLTPDGAERQLSALGFRDLEGARRAVADLTSGLSRRSRLMQQLLPLMMDWLSETPDPDLGLTQLRILIVAAADNDQLTSALRDSPVTARRLCQLLGTSRWLGDSLDRLPEVFSELGDDTTLATMPTRETLAEEAVAAVAVRGSWVGWLGAVRRFVRRGMLRIAIRDLLGMVDMPTVGGLLSDLADAAAAAALQAAQRRHHGPDIGFCVIAMGKWGGRELNYASDIDVLFAYDPGDVDPHTAHRHAQTLAQAFIDALAASTPEGTAFKVDADLRPEGTQGPLARSLDAYRNYYTQWSQPWELQALIKARPACGTTTTGTAFLTHTQPLTYPDTLPPNTLRTIRTLKARAERQRIPAGEDPQFHLKFGPGGLVDVEFTVQILQLMAGGNQRRIRNANTLAATEALASNQILEPEEAHDLGAAYEFCGRVRNRLFLLAGRPRDSLPTDRRELGKLGTSLGMGPHPGV